MYSVKKEISKFIACLKLDASKDYKWGNLKLSENKSFEWQLEKEDQGLEIGWSIRTKGDHAGARLTLGGFGYWANFSFYDHRHWDYKNNCWKTYDDEEDEDC